MEALVKAFFLDFDLYYLHFPQKYLHFKGKKPKLQLRTK